jgi:hypothetical protein
MTAPVSRRAVVAALWRDGDLEYLLHDGQVQAAAMVRRTHEDAVRLGRAKRALLNIARRWGKTFFFIVWCLEIMLRRSGARIPYAARSEVSVREFVEPILRRIARDAPPHLAPREYKGDWIIPASKSHLHKDYAVPVERGTPQWRDEDSRLVVKGCEDMAKADRLRGPAAEAAVVDEAGYIPVLSYVVRDVMAAQLLTTDGMMLVGSSAPESSDHEFWEFADEALEHGAYMHATVYDNPLLTERQIDGFAAEVGGKHTLAWRREGLSERIVDPTRAIVPEFAELEPQIVCEWPRPEYFYTWVAGDLGFIDLAVFAFAYVDLRAGGLLIIEDEVTAQRSKSTDINALVAKKERELGYTGERAPRIRVIDAAAITVADMDERVNLATGERATRDEAGPHIAQMIWTVASKDDADAALNALRVDLSRVRINPRCKTIIGHLRGGIWNKTRTTYERVERNGIRHHFDGIDAVKYLNRHVDRRLNPYPLMPPGISADTHFIVPQRSQQDRALSGLFKRSATR